MFDNLLFHLDLSTSQDGSQSWQERIWMDTTNLVADTAMELCIATHCGQQERLIAKRDV
jgi:hypothetical protein